MATRRGTKRRATSVALDAAILDSAVAVIGANGPDQLNLSEVARTAGATTGAVYSRYENREELLLDVWAQRCREPLGDVLGLAARAHEGDADAAQQAASRLGAGDARLHAAVALLIVAPRVDELAEVVLPETRAWFDEAPDGTKWRAALIPIAFTLGAIAFDSAVGAQERDWGEPLRWVSNSGAPAPRRRSARRTQREDDLAHLVHVDTGDSARDAILLAMASLMARSGLARATTSRVARTAGYSQSAVFELWPTRADLLAESAHTVLLGLVRGAAPFGQAAMAGDADGAARGLNETLGPGYHLGRRMRLELVLASMSDAQIAAAVAATDEAAVAALIERRPTLRMLAEAVRSVNLGLQLLQETIGGLDRCDFRESVAPLLAAAAAR